MSVTTYKWTLEQWHQLVETVVLAEAYVEFIEGEIVKRVSESIPHSEARSHYLQRVFLILHRLKLSVP